MFLEKFPYRVKFYTKPLHGLSDGDGVVVETGDVRVDGHPIARFQEFFPKDLLFIEEEDAIVQPSE